eukprot:15437204-Alexandrium_andersonii.AAC.1
MARHRGLHPTRELPGSASRPGSDHHRGNGDGAEARDQGNFVLNILRDVDLAPALQGRRPARSLAGR